MGDSRTAGDRFVAMSTMLATWVGVVGAILGGYIALQNYGRQLELDQRAAARAVDERVKYTFDLMRRFDDPGFVDFRQRFVDSVGGGHGCRVDFSGSSVKSQEIFALVEFFDMLEQCVRQDLCDGPTAERLAGPYAAYWYPHLRPHIEYSRKEDERQSGRASAYGDGIRFFAGKPANLDVCYPGSTLR